MADNSIIGKRFGRLVVVKLHHVGKNKGTWWECKCDCGNTKVVFRGGLTSGDTSSCGCYRNEHKKEFAKKHGLSCHPLYSTWSGMIQRCTNKNAKNYYRYGGRGICVCKDWLEDFEKFYTWAMNNGYSSDLTLDRIDNSNGYSPDNCRWSTKIEQQNNTRRNHNVTYLGITHSLAEWSRLLNVNAETLRYRVNCGDMKDFEKLPHSELIIGKKGE